MEYTFRIEIVPEGIRAKLLDTDNNARIKVSDWGREMLPSLPRLECSVLMRMIVVDVADLKCGPNARWFELVLAAQERGWKYIPLELIIPLRFAYVTQPKEEFLRLAHEEIHLPSGRSCRFALYNNGTNLMMLGRETGGDRAVWPKGSLLGFMTYCKSID